MKNEINWRRKVSILNYSSKTYIKLKEKLSENELLHQYLKLGNPKQIQRTLRFQIMITPTLYLLKTRPAFQEEIHQV
jgi:hypothetical protein